MYNDSSLTESWRLLVIVTKDILFVCDDHQITQCLLGMVTEEHGVYYWSTYAVSVRHQTTR